MIYDVAIIGAGAAGIFAAMELVKKTSLKVLVLEKARRLNDTRNTGLGWFGGSARSNVHLFLEPSFGGFVNSSEAIETFMQRLTEYTGSTLKPVKSKIAKKNIKRLNECGLSIDEPFTISLAEDKMIKLGNNLYQELKSTATLFHKVDIKSLVKKDDVFEIDTGEVLFKAKYCMLSMGRAGAAWWVNNKDVLQPDYTQSHYDFGIKLEFAASGLESLITKNPFFRLKFDEFKTSVPSFSGSIETEEVNHVKIANYRNLKSAKTSTATMSLLKTFKSTNSISDVYRLCEITNILSETQLLREPLSKWLNRTSMLSSLPEFNDIKLGLDKLLAALPNLKNKMYIYTPEARLNALEFTVDKNMQSSIKDLFIIGDMSGHTTSFVQAACTGIMAAQSLIK